MVFPNTFSLIVFYLISYLDILITNPAVGNLSSMSVCWANMWLICKPFSIFRIKIVVRLCSRFKTIIVLAPHLEQVISELTLASLLRVCLLILCKILHMTMWFPTSSFSRKSRFCAGTERHKITRKWPTIQPLVTLALVKHGTVHSLLRSRELWVKNTTTSIC